MEHEIEFEFAERRVFKYRGAAWLYLWLSLVEILCIGLVLVALERHEIVALAAVTVIGFLLGALGLVTIDSRSSIVIDKDGLGRVWPLFPTRSRGRIIRWDNVRLITAFPISKGRGQTVRAFNIYPKKKKGFSLMPSGKIAFAETMEQASDFVVLLNSYIARYQIAILRRDAAHEPMRSATTL